MAKLSVALMTLLVLNACKHRDGDRAAEDKAATTSPAAAKQTDAPDRAAQDKRIEEGMSEMDGFKDKMCACKDKTCADEVSADMIKAMEALSTGGDKDARPAPEQIERMTRTMEALTTCRTAASGAGSALPVGSAR